MVVGGWTDGGVYIDDVDVVDLRGEGDTCNPVADYPFLFRRGVMEIIGGRPWVCGGQIEGVAANPTDQCFEYQKEINTWVEVAGLMTARGWPAASMVDNKWFITGGLLGGVPNTIYQTTEVLEDGEFVPGPDLPEPLDEHCQVTLDNDVVFIGSDHLTCYLLDWRTKEWRMLPDPSTTRSQPACGMIRNSDNGQEVVIIGKNSSEILNLNDLTWRNGPSLPNFFDGGAVLQKRTTFRYGISMFIPAPNTLTFYQERGKKKPIVFQKSPWRRRISTRRRTRRRPGHPVRLRRGGLHLAGSEGGGRGARHANGQGDTRGRPGGRDHDQLLRERKREAGISKETDREENQG